MAQYRGLIQGQRGYATRLGNKNTGLTVEAQSWEGKVVVNLHYDEDSGEDRCTVVLEPHIGRGIFHTLYRGPLGRLQDFPPEVKEEAA